MSNLTREASNNEQEESVIKLEEWAINADYKIHFGCVIGKYSDKMIIDHAYHGGEIVVTSEGVIRFKGTEIRSEGEFFKAIESEDF